MVGAEQAQRIYVQIALGTTKADYPWPLDDEASSFWDRVEAEVAVIRGRGDDLEIAEVAEIPDLPPWVEEAPDAEPPPPPGEDSGSTPTAAAETESFHPGHPDQKVHGRRRKSIRAPTSPPSSAPRGKAPAKPSSGGVRPIKGASYDDPAAAKQFLDHHYGTWKKKELSDAEYAGLSFYQSPGFALMNGQRRGLPKDQIRADMTFGDADLKRARKASDDLSKGIAKAPPLPESVIAHRGFDAAQFGDLQPGMRIADNGFVSLSLTSSGVASVGKASKPGVMRLEVPQGVRAGAGSARELILDGADIDIVAVRTEGGTTYVDARLVGTGGTV